ncbi:hypothetical protein D3C86_1788580 [compost metagenome]
MQRHQVGIAQALGQARLQRLLDILAGRHHRQEMRLVGHQQVLVDIEHALDEGNRRLRRHLAKVMHAQADPIGMRRADRRTLGIQHPPTRHAL